MNKKVNTLLFVLGATLFNILVVLIVAAVLIIGIYGMVVAPMLPETVPHDFIASMLFIASIIVSFIVYRITLNKLLKKIKFEDYFDPIFGRRPPPKKKSD